ncbi:S-layer homology domain-containing protein [Paenibacillus sp. SI8]|uniref:S-layer homology domain-containing protein n=1 Tax=unclassified Paenibacillus TaxID=185978 RepID=UPI00346654FF
MGLRKWVVNCFMLLFLTSAILPSAFAASEAEEAPAYTLAIPDQSLLKGDTVEVLIKGSHLKDVYAYEINLEYDPVRLKLKDATTDLPGFSVGPIIKDNHIQLAFTRVGQGKGINGDQLLFKVHFEAISHGKAELLLSRVKVVDSALVTASLQIDSRSSLAITSKYHFDDIEDFEWAITAIEALADKGIVNGTGECIFSPKAPVTRADFVILLMQALELKSKSGLSFADVREGEYYAEPLAEARGLGIVQGDANGSFHPQDSITREDMMVLAERALRSAGQPSTMISSSSVLDAFTDSSAISDYAAGSVASLVQLGLVQGYANGIHPHETTNRAQAVVFMHKLVTYVQQKHP